MTCVDSSPTFVGSTSSSSSKSIFGKFGDDGAGFLLPSSFGSACFASCFAPSFGFDAGGGGGGGGGFGAAFVCVGDGVDVVIIAASAASCWGFAGWAAGGLGGGFATRSGFDGDFADA